MSHEPRQESAQGDERPVEAPSGIGTAEGAREARYAEAMREAAKAHTLTGMSAWDCVCACGGWPVFGEADVQHSDHVADAVAKSIAPLVEAEVAAAVSEAQAEVERLTSGAHNCLSTKIEAERADSAEAEVERLRGGIEALADSWDPPVTTALLQQGFGWDKDMSDMADDLRALLSPSPAATTGEDDEPLPDYLKELQRPAPVSSGEAATGEADRPVWLGQSLVAHEAQRRLDSLPCPKCGGDRLRADFIDPSRCHVAAPVVTPNDTEDGRCHGDRDGECHWDRCPQLRDGEPVKSGRHCPLDTEDGA